MKKIITVLLSVLLIAGLFTGCNGESVEELFRGSTPAPTPTPTPEPTPVETVVISFDANGGTVIGAIDSKTVEKGSEVNLPDITGAFEAPYGYQFASCWNTKADGSGTSYNVATPAYTFESNVTLYAQWNPVPFKFVAEDNNVKISFDESYGYVGEPKVKLVYSQDGQTFNPYTLGEQITLSTAGDEVYFKATSDGNSAFTDDWDYLYQFKIDEGKARAEGNVMFLLDETGKKLVLDDYAFGYLFYECENLTSVPMLPATELAPYCYYEMFDGCTGLTNIPEKLLPVTELADSCYCYMFYGCTDLTSIPEGLLPATELADSCYYSMFRNCTGLTSIPERLLPATQLAGFCYACMFNGTSVTGLSSGLLPAMDLAENCYYGMFMYSSLTDIPENLLPATTLTPNCYEGMFQSCTSLTQAPELPAETLENECYADMFNGCSSLNSVIMLAADISASDCLKNWLKNVSTTSDSTLKVANDTVKTAIESNTGSSAPMNNSGDSLVGSNWTVTITTP